VSVMRALSLHDRSSDLEWLGVGEVTSLMVNGQHAGGGTHFLPVLIGKDGASLTVRSSNPDGDGLGFSGDMTGVLHQMVPSLVGRSEEHTSELQSREQLV